MHSRLYASHLLMEEQELGRGAFGVAHSGVLRRDGTRVCVKSLHLFGPGFDLSHDQRATLAAEFRGEIDILSQLSHPNVLKFVGFVLDDTGTFPSQLVTELAAGSLTAVINRAKLCKQDVWKISVDVITGLEYMHSPTSAPGIVVHRDVKGPNVLLFGRPGAYTAKIGDLGLAKVAFARVSGKGSPFYMAPEVLDDTGFTPKADVFSFGITLAEALCQCFPAPSADHPDVFRNRLLLLDAARARLVSIGWDTMIPVLDGCTDKDFSTRLTAAQALELLREAKPATVSVPAAASAAGIPSPQALSSSHRCPVPICFCLNHQTDACLNTLIRPPCVGRSMQLGDLFDAQRDTFVDCPPAFDVGVSFWDPTLAESTPASSHGNQSWAVSTTMEEWCTAHGINGNLRASLAVQLSGGIPFQGQEEYLSHPAMMASSSSLEWATLTYKEVLGVNRVDLAVTTLVGGVPSTATHVVTGIEYGVEGHATIVGENSVVASSGTPPLQSDLGIVAALRSFIPLPGSASVSPPLLPALDHCTAVLECAGTSPMMSTGLHAAACRVQQLSMDTAARTPTGWGVPLRVYLTPLSQLLPSSAQTTALYTEISDDVIQNAARIFESYRKTGATTQLLLESHPALSALPSYKQLTLQMQQKLTSSSAEMVQCFRRILPIIRSQDSDGTSRALFFQLLSDVMESPSGPRAFEQLLAALKLRLDTVWSGMDKLRSSGLRIACSESDLRALDLNQHSLCLGLLVNDGFIAEQVAKVDQRVDDLVASCHHIASAMTALQTMSNEPDAESSEPTINICALGDSGKGKSSVLQSLSGRKEFEVKEQGRGMIPYDSIVEGPFFGSASYPQAKFLDNGGLRDASKYDQAHLARTGERLKQFPVDVFLDVVSDGDGGRHSPSRTALLKVLRAVYGDRLWEHLVVVQTRFQWSSDSDDDDDDDDVVEDSADLEPRLRRPKPGTVDALTSKLWSWIFGSGPVTAGAGAGRPSEPDSPEIGLGFLAIEAGFLDCSVGQVPQETRSVIESIPIIGVDIPIDILPQSLTPSKYLELMGFTGESTSKSMKKLRTKHAKTIAELKRFAQLAHKISLERRRLVIPPAANVGGVFVTELVQIVGYSHEVEGDLLPANVSAAVGEPLRALFPQVRLASSPLLLGSAVQGSWEVRALSDPKKKTPVVMSLLEYNMHAAKSTKLAEYMTEQMLDGVAPRIQSRAQATAFSRETRIPLGNGLHFNTVNGVICGTPSTAGHIAFLIRCRNVLGWSGLFRLDVVVHPESLSTPCDDPLSHVTLAFDSMVQFMGANPVGKDTNPLFFFMDTAELADPLTCFNLPADMSGTRLVWFRRGQPVHTPSDVILRLPTTTNHRLVSFDRVSAEFAWSVDPSYSSCFKTLCDKATISHLTSEPTDGLPPWKSPTCTVTGHTAIVTDFVAGYKFSLRSYRVLDPTAMFPDEPEGEYPMWDCPLSVDSAEMGALPVPKGVRMHWEACDKLRVKFSISDGGLQVVQSQMKGADFDPAELNLVCEFVPVSAHEAIGPSECHTFSGVATGLDACLESNHPDFNLFPLVSHRVAIRLQYKDLIGPVAPELFTTRPATGMFEPSGFPFLVKPFVLPPPTIALVERRVGAVVVKVSASVALPNECRAQLAIRTSSNGPVIRTMTKLAIGQNILIEQLNPLLVYHITPSLVWKDISNRTPSAALKTCSKGDFVKKVRAEWYFHDADVDQPSLRVTFDPARGTRVMRPVDPAPPGSVPSRVPTLWIPDLRDNLQGNYVDWTSEKCCCLWYEKTDSVLEAATGFEVLKLRDPERPEDAKISSDRVLRTRKDGARFVRPQDLYLWFSDCEEPEPAEYNHTVDLRRGAAARGIRVDIVKAAWWEFWASDSRTETTINYSQSVIWKCYPAP